MHFIMQKASSLHTIAKAISSTMPKRIAMVLSGCGVNDGSEIYETTSMLIRLDRKNANVSIFAPGNDQFHVINHIDGKIMPETRNVLVESARLSRGKVDILDNLQVNNFDGLVFPGGFGAAKNLCTYAVDGENMVVNEQVIRVVKEFHDARKPMCFACVGHNSCRLIKNCKVTFGKCDDEENFPYSNSVAAVAKQFGAVIENVDVDGVCVDEHNQVFSSPAFMKSTAGIYQIYVGLSNLITKLLAMPQRV